MCRNNTTYHGPRAWGWALLIALGLMAGAAHAQLNCNVGVEFYPGGGIKRCQLNGHHRLYTAKGQVVNCADGKPLTQYPNGRLQSCVIAQPQDLGEHRCARGSRVDVAPDGAVSGCTATAGG